jgi:hypothetical protein
MKRVSSFVIGESGPEIVIPDSKPLLTDNECANISGIVKVVTNKAVLITTTGLEYDRWIPRSQIVASVPMIDNTRIGDQILISIPIWLQRNIVKDTMKEKMSYESIVTKLKAVGVDMPQAAINQMRQLGMSAEDITTKLTGKTPRELELQARMQRLTTSEVSMGNEKLINKLKGKDEKPVTSKQSSAVELPELNPVRKFYL